MTSKFVIRDLFKLSGDVTVLACEGEGDGLSVLIGRIGKIQNDGGLRQAISFSGERKMRNQTRPKSVRAFETLEKVQLTVEEAQSGAWTLSIDD